MTHIEQLLQRHRAQLRLLLRLTATELHQSTELLADAVAAAGDHELAAELRWLMDQLVVRFGARH